MPVRKWLLLFLGVVACLGASSKAADLSDRYAWSPMKIGGGGWVVGMHLSPTEQGLIYVRADVSGAYRWNPATKSWKQLVTSASMPEDCVKYGQYAGVESIVSAPKDPNVAYMAFNNRAYDLAEGQIFKSTNRGDTWSATHFNLSKVRMEPNGEGRQEGERLAVDPLNSDVVYFASIQDGLWVTKNGGSKWAKVEAIPAGKAPHGVNTVIFDQQGGSTMAEGSPQTKVIYVSVEEGGIFQSSDAGVTWKKISDRGMAKAKPRDATLGPDRTYYVAYDNEKGSIGGIWKCAPDGKWSDITPQHEEGGKNQSYWAVAVDPADANHVVAMRNGGKLFDSHDQGSTWSYHLFELKSPNILWQGTQTNYFLSTGQLGFDPFEHGKLWFAEGFGVWWTKDLSSLAIPWQSASEGIEEVCGNDVIAPPGGKPVAAMWDVGAFYFDDVDHYTAQRSQPGFMSAWALDWCPLDPKFLVGVFRNHLGFAPHPNSTGFSTDGGRTWTRFEAVEKGTIPKGLEYGVIAVSAQSTEHIVWAPANKVLPYYTANKGVTWKRCSLAGATETGLVSYPMSQKALCADRVEPDTFYFYTPMPEGGLYRSKDGGAHFKRVGNPGTNKWNAILKSVPGHAGDLWLADNTENTGALRHSVDGGATWTEIPGLRFVANVGLGKAQAEGGYPTLYVAGSVATDTGIFRSTDQGASWDQISSYPLGIFDVIDALDGDKDSFGVVYLGFSGSGFAYGKPATSP